MPSSAGSNVSSCVFMVVNLVRRLNRRSFILLAGLLFALVSAPEARADDCNAQFKSKLSAGGTYFNLTQGDLVSGTLPSSASISVYNSANVFVYSGPAASSASISYVITTTGTYQISVSTGSAANITCSVPQVLTVTVATDTTSGVASNCTAGSTTNASCSLRDALAAATAYSTGSPAQSTNIQFSPSLAGTSGTTPFTITEANGTLTLPSYVTINGLTTGSGATLTNLITINGNHANRVFLATSSASNIALNNLIITGGSAVASPALGLGGGLYLPSGYTTINQCTITGNSSSVAGGGVLIGGPGIPGTITQSAIYGNTSASGAGVDAVGTLTITDTTITGNTATGQGGGVVVQDGVTVFMYSTTVNNNSASMGGGTYLVYTSNGSDLEVFDSVIAGNTATSSYPDVDYTSATFGDNGGNFYNTNAAKTAVNPNIAPLGSYGGPTQTMPALPGGKASCIADPTQEDQPTDQRGFIWTTNYGSNACTDAGSTQTKYSLAFTTQPAASYLPSVNFSPAPVVSVVDNGYALPATGNIVFTDAKNVVTGTKTVALTSSGAALSAAQGTVTSGDSLTGKYSATIGGATVNFSITSNTFNIATPVTLNHFAFTATPPTSTTAGVSFNVTVTAYSDSGTTVATAYTGPLKFTSTDSAAVLPTTLTITAGVGTFNITLKTAGSQTITVADSSGSPSLTSSSITVNAAAVASITAATGSGQSAVIGVGFANPLVVQMLDAFSNPVAALATFTTPSSGASASLSAASCTSSVTATPMGSCSLTATANGTANSVAYSVSAAVSGVATPATFSLKNTQRSTTISTIPTATSIVYGQPVTLNATISPSSAGGSTPSGYVKFTEGATVLTSTAAVSSAAASYAVSLPAVTTHTYTAQYLGDANFAAGTATNATSTVSVGKASSTLTGPTGTTQVVTGNSGSIAIGITGQFSGVSISPPSGTINYSILNSSSTSVASGSPSISSGAVTIPVPSNLGAGNYTVSVNYAGDANYSAATTITAALQVGQITPTVTFAGPTSPITYGTALGIAATATYNSGTVAGTFTYSATPTGGSASAVTASTVLTAGSYTLTANFTPTNTTLYSSASNTMALTVSKATSSITTAPTGSAITYGQTLASSMLSGGAGSVAGTFAWTTSTTVPTAGTASYSVTFTPTDTTDYTTATATASVTTSKATTSITTAPTGSAISYGQTLANSTLSGGVGSVAGSFAFTAPTTAPGAGTASYSVTFTPTDSTDYSNATTAVSVTTNKVTPTITTAPTASAITYGQTLANSTLSGGVASAAGAFAFNTPTTSPTAGSASYTVTFTPADTSDYNNATTTVSVTTNKAAPTITTAPTASAVTYGQTLANSTLSGGVASVAGSFGFTTSVTTPTVGTSNYSVTFTPADTTDYSTVILNVSVLVNRAATSIANAPTASAITYGQTLASSTLSGGAGSVAGSFAFTTPTTAPGAGTVGYSVTFTPADSTNYATATTIVSVTTNMATPTITTAPSASVITYGQTLASSTLSGGVASTAGAFAFNAPTTAPTAGTASYIVTFIPTDTADYNNATTTVSVTTNPVAQTINFTAPSSPVVYGSVATVNLSATGGASGNAVTFSVSSGPAVVSGSTLTIMGAGTVVIVANQAGSTNYTAATPVSQALVVSKASATLAGPATQPVFVVYSVTGTIPVTITGLYSASGITAPSGAINYNILNSSNTSIVSGALTIASGGVSVPLANTLAPGSYTVNVSYGGDANYAASASATAITLQVGQIQPVATIPSPGASLAYGSALGIAASASYNSNTVAGSFIYTAAPAGGIASTVTAASVLPAGSYTLTANFAPTDAVTYKSATATASLTVTKATPAVSLTSSVNPVLVQNSTTLTATVSSSISTPTGTVTFYDNTASAALVSNVTLSAGVATASISTLAVGTHSITAIYSGDTNFVTFTSSAVAEQVQDFSLNISTSASSTTSQTIVPGATATYNFTLSPTGSTAFPAVVTLSVSGLPTGATYTITPSSIAAGAGSTAVVVTINAPAQVGALQRNHLNALAPAALALLILPFSRRMRRRAKKLGRIASLLLIVLASGAVISGLTGCGAATGIFGQASHTYTVTVTGASGSLVHSTSVQLTIE